MIKKDQIRTAIAIVLAGFACNSYAQFGGSAGMGGMRHSKGGYSQNDAAAEGSGRSISRFEQLNNRLYDLRIRLLIQPGQSSAWEAFRARLIDVATARPQNQGSVDEQTALQALERQLSLTQNNLGRTTALYDACQNLFASFSPEQQRTADQSLPQLLAELARGESGASIRSNSR